jgi:uncharacterized protein involved in outer membrane biogenesis
MSKTAKILLAIIAIPIILIVAGIIVLKIIYTPEKLKAMVIPPIERSTHRTVTVGDLSLSVFPTIGVDISDFAMSNRTGDGFSKSPFVEFKQLSVRVKLLPLIKGNIEVASVAIDEPKMLFEVTAKNVSNYSDLSSATPEDKTAGNNAGTAFVIASVTIHRASIDYVNAKDNSATRVRGLSGELSVEGEPSAIAVHGSATADSIGYGTVESLLLPWLRGQAVTDVKYDLVKDVLTIEKGDAKVQDLPMKISGTVSDLKQKNMVLDMSIAAEGLNIADLMSLVPKEYMKKAEGVQGNGTVNMKIGLHGMMTDSTSADAVGNITCSNASIRYPKLPKPISDIAIISSFERSKAKQVFAIEKLDARLGDNPIHLSLTTVNFSDPAITLTMKGSLNLAEVGQFYPLEAGTELSGRLSADVDVAGRVKDQSSLKASGSLTFENVSAKTASTTKPVENLNGSIQFTNQAIGSDRLAMTIGKSDLAMSFKLRNYLSLMSTDKNAPKPVASMNLTSNKLFTSDVMSEDKPAAVPAQGEKKKTSLGLPNVEMDITGSIGTLTMQKFEFTNVKAAVRIENGIITMQNFSLNAFGGAIVSRGSINLQNSQKPLFDMALDINGVESHTMLSNFTSFGNRINGKMTMTTTMKGALDDTLGLVKNALNGGGKVKIENGSLKGFKVNESLAGALKLPDLETINFKDWNNSFTIENGRIMIKDLKITALNSDYVVNGSQGLDGTLDYAMALYLPGYMSNRISIGGFAGEAVNAFKEPDGRLKLEFNVGGTTDDPKVQFNTESARKKVEDAAKQKVADEAKKLGDQAKDKAGDLLKNLFKKK